MKLNIEQKTSELLTVRLTKDQRDFIESVAKENQTNMGAVVRHFLAEIMRGEELQWT